MASPEPDPVIDELREQIAELDQAIVAAVNRRLELVGELKRYKERRGIPFFDPEREAYLIAKGAELNTGPLSDEGFRSFYGELLALVKRELS